jgi:hypothetical protein
METPTVRLISVTTIDWSTFLGEANAILGRSPSRGIDGLPFEQLAAYIACIENIKNPDAKPVEALRTSVSVLEHASFGFLISTDMFPCVQQVAPNLVFVIKNDLGIVTGTVGAWKQSIVEGSKPQHPIEVRKIFNIIYLFMKKAGLHEIFSEYETFTAEEGTFYFR